VPAKTVRQNFYQIPIKQRVGNIPSVEVLLNGQHLVEMLFDTGASAIVINQGIAEKVGVTYNRDRVLVHTAGGVVSSAVANLNSMQAGQFSLKNVQVIVAPQLGGIAGLLGQPFFGNYDITIKEKVIELRAR
ncbi:MAG: retropepsin-like aspartic protease family protein, partial [Microcystaceae cyanobacterium]